MKHTKEPWVLHTHSNNQLSYGRIEDVHGKFIAVIHNTGTAEADSKRIISCVNAFEGIEDPEIWMKTNREHVDGLLKGGAQNADVAIKAEDLAGLKIRVIQSPIYIDMFNALGAKRRQTAFAKQPGEVPALIFKTLVLDAEQSGQRQRLQ